MGIFEYCFFSCLIPFSFFIRSVLPVWEELLLFNENFNYFIQNDVKVIVFFEVGVLFLLCEYNVVVHV